MIVNEENRPLYSFHRGISPSI